MKQKLASGFVMVKLITLKKDLPSKQLNDNQRIPTYNFVIKGLDVITLHVLEFYEEDYADIITSVFVFLL
jgi:hypothetical protein